MEKYRMLLGQYQNKIELMMMAEEMRSFDDNMQEN
jgi:hypothetical protein